MLWPHYLRTIPSLSIVALTPTLPAMKMAETVPAGFEISSRPLGPKNTVCRYRTTRDLTLNPLAIEEAVMTAEPDGRSALRLRLACSELADWSQTDLRRLALYTGEDAVTGSALHLWLTRRQAALYLRLPGQTERVSLDGYFSPGDSARRIVYGRRGERFQRLSAAARVFHLSRKIYVRAAKWHGKHHPAGGDIAFHA